MSYSINLSGHFDSAYNIYSSVFKGGLHDKEFLNNRGTHPLLYKNVDDQVSVFLPIVIGGKAVGYITSGITSTTPKIPTNSLVVLDSKEKIDNCEIKLTPKLLKVMKNVDTGTAVMPVPTSYYHQHTNRGGFKLQAGDIMKLCLLGYLELANEDALIEAMTQSAYAFRVVQGPNTSKANKLKAIYDLMECTSAGTRLNPKDGSSSKAVGYGDTTNLGHWDLAHIGGQMSYRIYRTSKEVSESDQIKWRKPPKSSVWPYTLEHHWFEIQESGIVSMNLQLTGLLQCSGNNSTRSAKQTTINETYPLFKNVTGLSNARNLLQRYFSECLSKTAPWSDLENDLKTCHFGNPNSYYGNRLDGKFQIVSMCLATGVVPVFNAGKFSKFEPISNKLVPPTNSIRVGIELFNQERAGIQYIPMLLMYQIGLISAETLAHATPIVKQKRVSADVFEIDAGSGLIVIVKRNAAELASAQKLATIRKKHAEASAEENEEELEEVL